MKGRLILTALLAATAGAAGCASTADEVGSATTVASASTTPVTAEPSPSSADGTAPDGEVPYCLLQDLIASSNAIVTMRLGAAPAQETSTVWVGERSTEEIAAIAPATFWSAPAEVEAVRFSRKTGPGIEDLQPINVGDAVRLLESVSISPQTTLPLEGEVTLLVSPVIMSSGVGLVTFGTLESPDSDVLAPTSVCNAELGERLSTLTASATLDDLLAGYFVDPTISNAVAEADQPPPFDAEAAEQSYQQAWEATDPNYRPVQIGEVPHL